MENLELLKYPIGRLQLPQEYNEAQLKAWINTIKALPDWMDACIENLDNYQLQTPYRTGGWTIQQVVHHVADSHMNAYIRVKLTLTEDNPTIKPYKESAWAELSDTRLVPVNVSVTLLHTLHIRLVALLENLTPEEWERTFHHPEQNKNITLWQLTAMYAWHSQHHTEHIIRLRQRMEW